MSPLKTVLIVDDSQANRQNLHHILCSDYLILEAENGTEALSILQKKADSISVLLLDIVMPVMDGYEVLRIMRQDRNLSKIPVIVISGINNTHSEVKALALGANDYVVKPYQPDIIRHRIANTIYLRETAAFINTVQYDALTGLYTKEYFYYLATRILRNNPSQKYDLVSCDIERFKLVNDLYGVQEGDSLLKQIAAMLASKSETHGICGRMGGDIFCMLLKRPLRYRSEDFLDSIAYANQLNMRLDSIIKYGIYPIEDTTVPLSIMCDRAYLALESIKGKYDTCFAFYDDAIRLKLLEEQFILNNMKTALQNHEFQVYYQAKYDLKTDEIVSAEALVRWIHPEKGVIPPSQFIPLFEKNGFITALDTFVWEESCKKIRSWKDRGTIDIPLSVNMSRADLYNPNIDQILISLIKKYNLSPSNLYLEITETAYTENAAQITATVEKLKKFGFIIEMDDFGSGYSSLNMLSDLPIDILKLDMKFIQNEKKGKNGKSILTFMISLAKWLDLHIIAEGVETEEQAKLLKSLGCERAQGYYYAKPLPAAEFEALLQETKKQPSIIEDSKSYLSIGKRSYCKLLPQILVFDSESADSTILREIFSEKYTILQSLTLKETLDCIQRFQSDLTALVLVVTDTITIKMITELVSQCNLHHISIITLHSSPSLVHACIVNGVSDCIMRPYLLESLANRIENAICRMQISKLEKEREINSAILEMKKRAEEDSLTGLLNRAEFESRIQEFFYCNNKPDGIFIIIDVDNFKKINDTLGHFTGDKVLCVIADTLHSLFHETNIISRIGGDEFALFIPYQITRTNLKLKLERLCNTITFHMEHLTLSCSAGICMSPENGLDYEALYNHADIALLNAKQNGKGQYVIFEKGLETPQYSQLEQKAIVLLNDVSDAMFVCDALTNEIIYINDTACRILDKPRKNCVGAKCHQLFWDSCNNCDRCCTISTHTDTFYEEDTILKDGKTNVHIKAKLGEWDGKKVKIHYLQNLHSNV